MIRYENECRHCATSDYPCLGITCPYLKVPHYYCDRCNEEDTLYHYDDSQLCIVCIEKSLEKVE